MSQNLFTSNQSVKLYFPGGQICCPGGSGSNWHFSVFLFDYDVRDAYAKKTADEIPAEGNCRRFLQSRHKYSIFILTLYFA